MKYFIGFIFMLSFLTAFTQVKIVVLGSSTAAGVGVSEPDSAWVNRYQAYLQDINPTNEVINLAHGGYTTFNLLPTGINTPSNRPNPDPERNISAALDQNPDAIIINLPSNDTANEYSVEEQLENYRTMLLTTNFRDIPVWIATTQPRNLDAVGRQSLIEMRDSTFAIFGDKAIDFWSTIAQSSGRINVIFDSGDGVHLNDRAHRILFERVAAINIHEAILTATDLVFENKENLLVYPNPATNLLHVNFENGLNTQSHLQITDMTGRVIKSIFIEKQTSNINIIIDELPIGMYQLILNDGTVLQNQLFFTKY